MDVASAAGLRDDLAVLVDGRAAAEHEARLPGDLPALERVVVDVHDVGLGGDRVLDLRVEDDDVGVEAWRERALGVEPEDPRGTPAAVTHEVDLAHVPGPHR